MPKAERPQKARGEDVQINPGKTASIIASSPVHIDETYRTSTENHHPMEPHATVAVWDGPDKLTLYDATQGVKGGQGTTAYLLGARTGQCERHLVLHRRRIWLQRVAVGTSGNGGHGSKGSEPAGQIGHHPSDDVHQCWPSARNHSKGAACYRPNR